MWMMLGEVDILAVNYNEVHPSGIAAIDAITTPGTVGVTPIGNFKGSLHNPDASRYLDALTSYPHTLTNQTAPSAVDVSLGA